MCIPLIIIMNCCTGCIVVFSCSYIIKFTYILPIINNNLVITITLSFTNCIL